MRKTMIAKCNSGNATRNGRLLEEKNEGKERMKTVGRVDIPPKAFMTVLKPEE